MIFPNIVSLTFGCTTLVRRIIYNSCSTPIFRIINTTWPGITSSDAIMFISKSYRIGKYRILRDDMHHLDAWLNITLFPHN